MQFYAMAGEVARHLHAVYVQGSNKIDEKKLISSDPFKTLELSS